MSDHTGQPKAEALGGLARTKASSLWALLVLLGPGIITSSVDNDAGGIATYSLAGAQFGLSMLWPLIPVTILLLIVQDMVARLAVVSGKGLSDLIRERFGVKLTVYTMIALLINNLGTTLAEFAGIAAAMEIFGVSKYLSVPFAMMLLMWLVVKGTYSMVEKVFLSAAVFYAAYVIVGFLVKPDWTQVFQAMASPQLSLDTPYVVMLVAMTGTTVSPWMLFYLQASMVDKGLGVKDLKAARIDVVVGSTVLAVVAFFIVLACAATLHKAGITINEASEAALALEPLAGKYCTWLFAFGLLNGSLFAASILPLSTAYTVCEAFGWESSLHKKFSEAPQFYGLYCSVVLLSGLVVLVPGLPLIPIMFVTQVPNALVLAVVLAFMLVLIRDPRIMGDYAGGKLLWAFCGMAVFIIAGVSLMMLWLLLTGTISR